VYGRLLLVSALGTIFASSQITDPLPNPGPSGLTVVVEPWTTIPASRPTSSQKTRINHLKPCPDGVRLFCNDLNDGNLWVIPNRNSTIVTKFLSLRDYYPSFTDSTGLGTGFASFAFHPEFVTPGAPGYGKFYTAHSDESTTCDFAGPLTAGVTAQVGVITEWTMANPADDALTSAPPNFTRRVLLRIGFPHDYHDTQELSFNPTAVPGDEDYGCLFVCVGDGGSIVLDQPGNINRPDSPLGCIHRIVPVLASATGTGFTPADFTLSTNGNYYIPSGPENANPQVSAADPTPGDGFPVVRETYARGFRNPHRISWDSEGTHKMFCGNIGENLVEEIELVRKGRNYGWPYREGSFLFNYLNKNQLSNLPVPDTAGYTYPVVQFDHDTDKAVVGGFVYRGSGIPALYGNYLFSDVITGNLYLSREADMKLITPTATGQTPAQPLTVNLKKDNALTTFRTVVGNASRADMRFGIDHQQELYMLSKQNGVIYRIKQDSNAGPTIPLGGSGDWAAVRNFEDGGTSGLAATVGFNDVQNPGMTSAQITDDPREGAVNRVLRLQGAGSPGPGSGDLKVSFPVPEIPNGSYGTLFLRMYVPKQDHNISFGLSESAAPATYDAFKVQARSLGSTAYPPGFLDVRNGGAFQSCASLVPGCWYSLWIQVDNANDSWRMYAQGGNYDSPSLIAGNVAFRQPGTSASLKRFFIYLAGINNDTMPQNAREIYLDDIQVDVGHFNATVPATNDWRLVDSFEGSQPLAGWQLPDNEAQGNAVFIDTDGNRYLRRAASSTESDNSHAIIAHKLPFVTNVGSRMTTFFRFRLEGGQMNHQFGVSSLDPNDPSTYTPADFESHLRFSSAESPGKVDLYSGLFPFGPNAFVTAAHHGEPLPPLANGVWHKMWMVADNTGAASGGQKWQAYLQRLEDPAPVPLADSLYFHRGAEAPITHFLSISTTGEGWSFGNDAIHLDDIYAFDGVNLTDPVAPKPLPAIFSIEDDAFAFEYPTETNRLVQAFSSDDLSIWEPIALPVEGTGSWREITGPLAAPRRFYQALSHSRRAFHPATWSSTFAEGTVPSGMSLFSPPTSSWTVAPGKLALSLLSEQATPVVPGMVPRPGSYALAPGNWRNVDIRVSGRTLRTTSTPNRDVIIPFGYVDETHYYYAHFAAISDGAVHTVIMKVNGPTSRSAISVPVIVSPAPFQSLASTQFRVTHRPDGQIAAYCNNLTTPVMTAVDATYPAGRVGFGSFDDPAEFTSITVTGDQQ